MTADGEGIGKNIYASDLKFSYEYVHHVIIVIIDLGISPGPFIAVWAFIVRNVSHRKMDLFPNSETHYYGSILLLWNVCISFSFNFGRKWQQRQSSSTITVTSTPTMFHFHSTQFKVLPIQAAQLKLKHSLLLEMALGKGVLRRENLFSEAKVNSLATICEMK